MDKEKLTEILPVRISASENDILSDISEKEDRSKSSVARRLIKSGLSHEDFAKRVETVCSLFWAKAGSISKNKYHPTKFPSYLWLKKICEEKEVNFALIKKILNVDL